MWTIDAQPTSDGYVPALTLQNVFNGSGGGFIVTGADVFVQLQYGKLGDTHFTTEFHSPPGSMILYPGTVGVRFRSYLKGTPATVTAFLSEAPEPPASPVPAPTGGGSSGPTVVSSGQRSGTHGTPTAASSSSIPCAGMVVEANAGNTGNVYLGGSGVTTATGYVLAPGASVAFDIANVASAFFDVDNTADGISWLAVT